MIHLTENNIAAWCGDNEADINDLITLQEALSPDGRHFDCKECHKKLTDGKKHSESS